VGTKLDLDGHRFGRLIATNKLRPNGYGTSRERLCYCDCGNETWVISTHLVMGRRVSCGCAPGMKLPSGESSKNEILNTYKQRSKKLGFDWVLTKDQFLQLVTNSCYYCNRSPSNLKKSKFGNGDFAYNGIDRRDNTLGYTLQNSVSCCVTCNRAKGDMTVDNFISWVRDISNQLL